MEIDPASGVPVETWRHSVASNRKKMRRPPNRFSLKARSMRCKERGSFMAPQLLLMVPPDMRAAPVVAIGHAILAPEAPPLEQFCNVRYAEFLVRAMRNDDGNPSPLTVALVREEIQEAGREMFALLRATFPDNLPRPVPG